jgi:hypothetical protein
VSRAHLNLKVDRVLAQAGALEDSLDDIDDPDPA